MIKRNYLNIEQRSYGTWNSVALNSEALNSRLPCAGGAVVMAAEILFAAVAYRCAKKRATGGSYFYLQQMLQLQEKIAADSA